MSKGKGQQVMEHNWFPLECQLPDGKGALQTEQKCSQLQMLSAMMYNMSMLHCRFSNEWWGWGWGALNHLPLLFSGSMYLVKAV